MQDFPFCGLDPFLSDDVIFRVIVGGNFHMSIILFLQSHCPSLASGSDVNHFLPFCKHTVLFTAWLTFITGIMKNTKPSKPSALAHSSFTIANSSANVEAAPEEDTVYF